MANNTATTIKTDLINNIEQIKTMRHPLTVSDIGWAYGVRPEVATTALLGLVSDGVLAITGRTQQGLNLYKAA